MRLILEDGTEVKLCNELEEQLNKAINVAKEEKKDTGFFEGKEGKNCWVVCSDGIFNEASCNESRELLNEFTSIEFAEKIRNKQLLERKLIKFSLEHDGDKIDFDDTEHYKYYIYYSYSSNELHINTTLTTIGTGEIQLYSREIAKQAIKEFHDDLIKYFTEWRIL